MELFLSHSSRDKPTVRKLATRLQRLGVNVWLDEWNILVGDSVTQAVQKGIVNCDYLAVWLTKHSVESQWVEREWMAKFHSEMTVRRAQILPLLADDCPIPALLVDKRYADFRTDFDSGVRDLVARLFPGNDKFISAAANLRDKTADLWSHLRWLPTNRAIELTCEMLDSTFRRVSDDLELLAEVGNFFAYTKEKDYVASDGQDVYELRLTSICPRFIEIVDTVSRE